MAALRPLIVGIALVLVFTFCIFSFAMEFIRINNPSSDFVNNSQVEDILNDVNHSIADLKETSDTAVNKTAGATTTTSGALIYLIFEGAFDVPKSMLTVATGSLKIFTKMIYLSLLGQASPFYLVFAVFNFVMIITVVLLIIKAIRSGESG